jgi:hypothetical protein
MIKAVCRVPLKDGGGERNLYVLGLTAENVRRLVDGKPIAFNANALGIGGSATMSICYGETGADIAAGLADSGLTNLIMAVEPDLTPCMPPRTDDGTGPVQLTLAVTDSSNRDPANATGLTPDAFKTLTEVLAEIGYEIIQGPVLVTGTP